MVEVKGKKSVKTIIGIIICCAVIIAIFLVVQDISANKKIDKDIEIVENEIKELKEKKNSTSSLYEQSQIEQEIMQLESKSRMLEFDKKNDSLFSIFSVGIITFVLCAIVYSIGNKDKIMAAEKKEQEERFNMFSKAMANAAKEFNPEYKSFTCPNCGANLAGNNDIETCNFCGTKLTKVGKFH